MYLIIDRALAPIRQVGLAAAAAALAQQDDLHVTVADAEETLKVAGPGAVFPCENSSAWLIVGHEAWFTPEVIERALARGVRVHTFDERVQESEGQLQDALHILDAQQGFIHHYRESHLDPDGCSGQAERSDDEDVS